MTEPNNNPPDPANENNPEAAREAEIERILTEAAGMIDLLEEQIGAEGPSPGSIADLYVEDERPPADEIEDELDEVEAILQEVQGGGADETAEDQAPADRGAPQDQG